MSFSSLFQVLLVVAALSAGGSQAATDSLSASVCSLGADITRYTVRLNFENCPNRADLGPYFKADDSKVDGCISTLSHQGGNFNDLSVRQDDYFDLSVPKSQAVTVGIKDKAGKVSRTVHIDTKDGATVTFEPCGKIDTQVKACDLPLYHAAFSKEDGSQDTATVWGNGAPDGLVQWQCPPNSHGGATIKSDTQLYYKQGDQAKENKPLIVLDYCIDLDDNAINSWCQAGDQ